jgi:hypothetical protein
MMENLNFALIDLYSYIEYFEYGGIFAISLLAGIVTVIPIPAYELVVFAVIFMGRSFLNDSISKINDVQLLMAGLAITISYAVTMYLTFRIDWTRVMGKRWSDPGKDV